MVKQSTWGYTLNIDIDEDRRWIEYHFTLEKRKSFIEKHNVKPTSSFDKFSNNETKEAFHGTNTRPLSKENHHQKGKKCSFLDYRLQFIRAYQILKLNKINNYFTFFIKIYSKPPKKLPYQRNKIQIFC